MKGKVVNYFLIHTFKSLFFIFLFPLYSCLVEGHEQGSIDYFISEAIESKHYSLTKQTNYRFLKHQEYILPFFLKLNKNRAVSAKFYFTEAIISHWWSLKSILVPSD